MIILLAVLFGYSPTAYFGILILSDQAVGVDTATVVLAISLAFLNTVINPHIYGESTDRKTRPIIPTVLPLVLIY